MATATDKSNGTVFLALPFALHLTYPQFGFTPLLLLDVPEERNRRNHHTTQIGSPRHRLEPLTVVDVGNDFEQASLQLLDDLVLLFARTCAGIFVAQFLGFCVGRPTEPRLFNTATRDADVRDRRCNVGTCAVRVEDIPAAFGGVLLSARREVKVDQSIAWTLTSFRSTAASELSPTWRCSEQECRSGAS